MQLSKCVLLFACTCSYSYVDIRSLAIDNLTIVEVVFVLDAAKKIMTT